MTDREIMQQALSAFEAIMFEKDAESCQIIAKNARYLLREALAQPEQEEVKVDIGVDVTAAGTSVVAFNCRADGARECFYAEWHPMPKRVPVEWDDDEWVKKAMEMSRDFVERAKARQQPPPTDTITMAELRKTDLYRKVQTQLLRDILRSDNT